MANLETALENLESILREEFPLMLPIIQAEKNDGIRLPAPVEYHWEEVRERLGPATPIVLLIPEGTDDPTAKDMLFDGLVRFYLIATDQSKKHLTRRLLRYEDALKRILRKPFRRTLNQSIVSAKVTASRFGATYLDRDNLFARDFNSELTLRIQR